MCQELASWEGELLKSYSDLDKTSQEERTFGMSGSSWKQLQVFLALKTLSVSRPKQQMLLTHPGLLSMIDFVDLVSKCTWTIDQKSHKVCDLLYLERKVHSTVLIMYWLIWYIYMYGLLLNHPTLISSAAPSILTLKQMQWILLFDSMHCTFYISQLPIHYLIDVYLKMASHWPHLFMPKMSTKYLQVRKQKHIPVVYNRDKTW